MKSPLCTVGKVPWRRKWQPTPVFLPRESRGQRSLAGYSPWGRKKSDTTERLIFIILLWVAHFPSPPLAVVLTWQGDFLASYQQGKKKWQVDMRKAWFFISPRVFIPQYLGEDCKRKDKPVHQEWFPLHLELIFILANLNIIEQKKLLSDLHYI